MSLQQSVGIRPLELPFGSPLIFSREPFIFTVRLLGQAARRHLHFKKASARGFVSFLFSASLFFSRTWGVSTAVFHLFVFFKVFYHIISHRSQARRSSLSETLTQSPAPHLALRPQTLRVPPGRTGRKQDSASICPQKPGTRCTALRPASP